MLQTEKGRAPLTPGAQEDFELKSTRPRPARQAGDLQQRELNGHQRLWSDPLWKSQHPLKLLATIEGFLEKPTSIESMFKQLQSAGIPPKAVGKMLLSTAHVHGIPQTDDPDNAEDLAR